MIISLQHHGIRQICAKSRAKRKEKTTYIDEDSMRHNPNTTKKSTESVLYVWNVSEQRSVEVAWSNIIARFSGMKSNWEMNTELVVNIRRKPIDHREHVGNMRHFFDFFGNFVVNSQWKCESGNRLWETNQKTKSLGLESFGNYV